MLRIVMEVAGTEAEADGIKEALAVYCERFGDCRVVEITARPEPRATDPVYWQTGLWDKDR